jgi:hypothetical protein
VQQLPPGTPAAYGPKQANSPKRCAASAHIQHAAIAAAAAATAGVALSSPQLADVADRRPTVDMPDPHGIAAGV